MTFRLSPREVRLICRRYRDEEKSIPEIMAEFGKSNISIYKVLKRHKIPLRKAPVKIHNQKLTDAMRDEIIALGMDRYHRKVIAKTITEKYGIEVFPSHVSCVLSEARSQGVKIPYYLANYVRAAPSFRRSANSVHFLANINGQESVRNAK